MFPELRTLFHLMLGGTATQREVCPPLSEHSRGLPTLTDRPCTGCDLCAAQCPTDAITVAPPGQVSLDLGRCVACGLCTAACPTGTITPSRSTEVAVRQRADLVLSNQPSGNGPADALPASPLRRSLHYRAISTGDNATDLEAAATHNPIFDASRFGIHGVASPRHADALLVTGPVGRAMQEPLRRCYEAMPEPRLVIAAGAAAISGGVHSGGYAQACGVDSILPVSIYIPGHPPHPWMLLHGLLVAMGRMAPARLGAGKATAAVLERPPARDTR